MYNLIFDKIIFKEFSIYFVKNFNFEFLMKFAAYIIPSSTTFFLYFKLFKVH